MDMVRVGNEWSGSNIHSWSGKGTVEVGNNVVVARQLGMRTGKKQRMC